MTQTLFFWQIIFIIYVLFSLYFIFGGLTMMGYKAFKIHKIIKKILNFPIFRYFPLFTFVIVYTLILFVFYDNVCNSIYLYNRSYLVSILLIIFEVQPFIAIFIFALSKIQISTMYIQHKPENYCFERKRYYVYVLFLEFYPFLLIFRIFLIRIEKRRRNIKKNR